MAYYANGMLRIYCLLAFQTCFRIVGPVLSVHLFQVVWTRQGLQMKANDKHQMTYDEASGKVSLNIR